MSAPPKWLAALCAAPELAPELPSGESERFARLAGEGWPITLAQGRVRLRPGVAALDRCRLAAALAPWGVAVEAYPFLDSTQDEARCLLAAGARPPLLVLAEWQRAGRGRLGRAWRAPPMSAILATLAFSVARPLSGLAGLSPALGVALAEALAAGGIAELGLKWPNDLLRAGRKLGGLLVEALPADAGAVLFVGFGINADPEAARAAPVPAASLAEAGGEVDRNVWIPRLVSALIAALRTFEEAGFPPFRARYARFDALSGRALAVEGARGRIAGVALGVGDDGALLLRSGGELLSVATGEVWA